MRPPPPLGFRYVTIFRKDFTFSRKYELSYVLWVVALLGACEVIKDGRHLGFYPKLEVIKKGRKKACAFTSKKGKKPRIILQKWLDTLATCDVISRNHRNDSMVTRYVSKEYAHNYWKRQVWIISRLENFKRTLMGVIQETVGLLY